MKLTKNKNIAIFIFIEFIKNRVRDFYKSD